jgi:site-specific recombinase XerD
VGHAAAIGPHPARLPRGHHELRAVRCIEWREGSIALLSVSIKDVLAYREYLVANNAAPKTINRRISSLSSFYKYLGAAAAEIRLPITVPNPAHAQFISKRVH